MDRRRARSGIAMTAKRPAALDVCKCLNCGMCATGYVAPLLGATTPERRLLAVSYLPASTGLPASLTFVDPGIPIAIA